MKPKNLCEKMVEGMQAYDARQKCMGNDKSKWVCCKRMHEYEEQD